MAFIRHLFENSKRDHWSDGIHWIGWSLLGFLPVLVTILLLKLYGQPVLLSIFTDNGEFAIYSATYLGAALYIVMKDNQSFPSRSFVSLVLVLLLIGSAVLYSQVAMNNFLLEKSNPAMQLSLDKDVVRTISQGLLPVVLLLTYLIVVAESIRTAPDPSKMSRNQFENLNKQFEDLGGNDND